ncbi:MAG: DUF2335 domain-containing protein [Chitinispirillales bacterium]|nr:DUF2335 domain-containing protein [Chitinispirillales bacterium]
MDKPTSVAMMASHQTHIGPLPPADEFVRYNDGCPDAADRILSMAEQALAVSNE